MLARLLCATFAKDIIEVPVEKTLSQTKAEVHFDIIDRSLLSDQLSLIPDLSTWCLQP